MRNRYGDFYTMGIPSISSADAFGTVYVLTDPKEMMKVLRLEGSYPKGSIESQWALRKYNKKVGSPTVGGFDKDDYGIFGNGEGWKRIRSFWQTDMLCPKAARGYIPGMVEAAEYASRNAPFHKEDLTMFGTRCAFDMFNTFMFGEMVRSACPPGRKTEENEEFCEAARKGLEIATSMVRDPYQYFMSEIFGVETKKYKQLEAYADTVLRISKKKVHDFKTRKEQGLLSQNETNSYLYRAIERQKLEDSNVTEEEVMDLCCSSLWASVDTTSSVLNLNLLQIALNPHTQDKLHDQLSRSVQKFGHGRLNADAIAKSATPYLHAVIRETHRLTPAAPTTLIKNNIKSHVQVHGLSIPRGSTFMLDHYSLGMDPKYVPHPHDFRPERFLSQAVEERAHTQAATLDNVLYKEPFGQGVRRCPGSRVANYEVLVMLSQLVLDWKIQSPVKSLNDVQIRMSTMMQPVLPQLDFIPR